MTASMALACKGRFQKFCARYGNGNHKTFIPRQTHESAIIKNLAQEPEGQPASQPKVQPEGQPASQPGPPRWWHQEGRTREGRQRRRGQRTPRGC